VGCFDEGLKYTQDYDLWFRMFRHQELVYINTPLCKVRSHQEQGTVTEAIKMWPDEAKLWLHIINDTTKQEAERMFGSVKEFYRCMYVKITMYGDKDISYKLYEKYINETESENILKKIKVVNAFLSRKKNKLDDEICIFCAGRYGIQLYYELKTLGICVHYFVDNAPNKHGVEITDGIICLSIEELYKIKNNVFIIVATLIPQAILEKLVADGYKYIATKQEIDMILIKKDEM
jgi:hypothetical protein